jgi:hypothetical protein
MTFPAAVQAHLKSQSSDPGSPTSSFGSGRYHHKFRMSRNRANSSIAVSLLISCLTLLGLTQTAHASPRLWEPLLLKGIQLSPLLGTRVDRLEVMAVHGGQLTPIPFQVDAVRNGRFVLTQGPHASTPEEASTLERADELTIMMFDLGERAPQAVQLPEGALEIAVHDPLGGPDRYAYIDRSPKPRLSTVRYVDYNPQQELIETDHYRLGLKHELPADIRFQNHRGQGARNLISGFELRGTITILKVLKFSFSENDIDSDLLAYHAGPVRVVRRLGQSFLVIRGIHSPQVSTIEFYYRDFAQEPFTVRFPFGGLYSSVEGRAAVDFKDVTGFSLFASGLKNPLELGKGASLPIKSTQAPAAKWLAVRGDGRLMIGTVMPSPELSLIDERLYYRAAPLSDGSQTHDLPAAVGIASTGWERMPSGPHLFNPLMISVPEDSVPARIIAESLVAPIVTVRAVLTPDLPPAASIPISRVAATISEEVQ